jgi:hypothetical protein
MIVASLAPDSASSVIAQWRNSWNLKPRNPALVVKVGHAERQLLMGFVGWNAEISQSKAVLTLRVTPQNEASQH